MADMGQRIVELETRRDALGARLSFLLRRLNTGAGEMPMRTASPAVMEFVIRGDRNAAISAYMDETNSSLNDVKCHVEVLQNENVVSISMDGHTASYGVSAGPEASACASSKGGLDGIPV